MELFLETDRLLLRRFTEADVENLVELDSDPEVMRFLTGGKPTPRQAILAETLPRFMAGGYWVLLEKESGQFLGWFEFQARKAAAPGEVELGYRIRRAAWGKGYATEGSRALIRKGFAELGAERIVAFTMAVNLASRRVMEKAGLRYIRTFHEQWEEPIAGAEHGEVEYALTRAEWTQCGRRD